jgi:Stealth protein CR2, conserved region 2/Stealth protein CR1, conserved region 1
MPSTAPISMTQIDAVITWVDGADPAHHKKRLTYMMPAANSLHENGVNPHRWACGNELTYCLQSIAHHAPWIERIWIVTDAQTPNLSHLLKSTRDKITIIDHHVLFDGFESALPTFNSLAIESAMWRIPDLADHFIYFNDDVFLTTLLHPDDVFRNGLPVLRGKWVDYSDLINTNQHSNPALFNQFVQINAAALHGYDASHLFASAHVVHPMRKSVMASLFDTHRGAFLANMSHRFRDIGQFLPQALHNHACLSNNSCVVHGGEDYLHLRSGALIDYGVQEVVDYFRQALWPEYKFLCINDLGEVEAAIPQARTWIEQAIGARPLRARVFPALTESGGMQSTSEKL